MSSIALALENALENALQSPSPVAQRIARGDAFALPVQSEDGVLIRLIGMPIFNASLDDDSALASFEAEIDLQKLGPSNVSALQALASLLEVVHARLVADRSLGGVAQRIVPAESDFLEFKTVTGGEMPVHSAKMRYVIYSNINPQTLGA